MCRPIPHRAKLAPILRGRAAQTSRQCPCPVPLGTPSFAEHFLRFSIPCDDQRIAAVSLAHFLQERIHCAGFSAICNAELVLRGCDAERADHHRRERIGKFALEHRPFARHHAIVLSHFANAKMEGKRPAGELAAHRRNSRASNRSSESLRSGARLSSPKNPAHLPQHFFHAHVRTGVSRSVVSGKKELQSLPGFHGLPAPSIHSSLFSSIRALTQASSTESMSIMGAHPVKGCRLAAAGERSRRPVAIFVREVRFAAELQERKAVTRKTERACGPFQLRLASCRIPYSKPNTAETPSTASPGRRFFRRVRQAHSPFSKRAFPIPARTLVRASLALSIAHLSVARMFLNRRRTTSDKSRASGFSFRCRVSHRVGNEIHGHNIDAIGGAKRKRRKSGEKYKSANHIELVCLGAAAVAQHDAGPKNRARIRPGAIGAPCVRRTSSCARRDRNRIGSSQST